MVSNGYKERFLKYKKLVIILICIILLLTIGMILTFAFMNDNAGRFYFICVEAFFIYLCGNKIYFLLSETIARKINPKDERFHLSKKEYERFLKQSKANDKYAK